MARMADKGAVELLLSGYGLAHLEKQAGVRPVGNGLVAELAHLARPFELIVGLPVLLIRGLLRKPVGLSVL